MIVSSLTQDALAEQLRREGIQLRIGFCVARIRSSFASVARGIHQLYADYPLEADDSFCDFHVSVEPPPNLRRWFAPQAIFRFDNHRPFKPLPANQAYPLLEWGLNWCFSTQYHRHAVIHGAVIERNGQTIIMPAPPGSGKSTLCAALVSRGWRLLSDELTLVRLNDARIIPMCRPISLKNESLQIMRDFAPEAVFGEAALDTSKGTVNHMRAPLSSVQRSLETTQASHIVFPKYQSGANATWTQVPKAESFMKLAENTFNYSMLGLEGFKLLTTLVDQCGCHAFHYSRLDEAIDQFNQHF